MVSDISTDDDDAVWQTVTKPTTKRRLTTSPEIFKHISKAVKNNNLPSSSNNNVLTTLNNNDNIPTTSNNRFATLQTDNIVDDDNDANEEVSEAKPPPIFIPNVSDIKTMINNLSNLIKSENYSYKSMRDGQVRLMIKDIQSYRTIVKYFDDKKINFHTYQLKQERAFRVVVKNLHFSTPISAIKEEIQSLGHQVRNVMNIKSRMTKQPMSMFFIDLEPNQNNKSFYEIRSILNAIVKIEPPLKTKEIIQCYRCQGFGHSKTYCRNMFNCVKCGLNHPSDTCPKSKETTPQCVNCLQYHTANYKGCQVYRNLLKRKFEHRRNNLNIPQVNYNHNTENFPTFKNNDSNNRSGNNQFSYAQVTRNDNNQQEQHILKSLETFMKQQNELTNKLISMMQLIITKLCV